MSPHAPAIDSQTVRFVLDGEMTGVSGLPPTTTILEYLRNVAGRSGTKEGCAEGDCGACAVVLGELTEDGHGVRYSAVNSCIRYLPTVDGKELVTVESLQGPGGELHPVQQAMVDHHASQCGFCTPGFVMSLFALYLSESSPTRDAVVTAIAGNLCRCTGYRPIVDAGCHMSSYPEPAKWGRSEAQCAARLQSLRGLRDAVEGAPLNLPGFRAPRGVDELAAVLEAAPQSLVLAGGTDVGLWTTKHLRDLPPIVYVGAVPELQEIRTEGTALWIGAGVSLSVAWPAIVAAHPTLAELARRFASPLVCNSGTLGGNVANGSPIGDSMPALIALGAEIDLRRGGRKRRVALERFYLGYQKKDLAPGEFVVGIVIPASRPQRWVASYKLAKRFEQDISAVCSAFVVEVADGRIVDARLAYGGMAAIPMRALSAEAALKGQPWSEACIYKAMEALATDFKPLTDARATSEYRLRAAGSLLQRFYLEHANSQGPLRLGDALISSEQGPRTKQGFSTGQG
jgi:xanthine dehydrogenase small subunit